jgi:hypothetical protein
VLAQGCKAALVLLYALLATPIAGCQTNRITGSTTGSRGPAQCPTNSAREPDGTCICDLNYSACQGDGGEPICANVEVDIANCGTCGVVCTTGEACLGGECQCKLTVCPLPDGGLICTDPDQDPENCGDCLPCPADQYCADPLSEDRKCACTDSRPGTDIQICDGTCVDLDRDPYNCGACHSICLYGPCAPGDGGTGVCGCESPLELCGSSCVDPRSDFSHCGGCTACSPPATQCVDSNCQ